MGCSPEEARTLFAKREVVIVDVRSVEEWAEGHVPGSIHAPEGEISDESLPDERKVLLMTADGDASDGPEDAEVIDGGMEKWREKGLPLQPSGDAAEPVEDPPDEPLEERISTG
jgi:rhodanese-related sulfurtransferase